MANTFLRVKDLSYNGEVQVQQSLQSSPISEEQTCQPFPLFLHFKIKIWEYLYKQPSSKLKIL